MILPPAYRTKMALQNGVDVVFLLPSSFGTSTAEVFAESAVSMLHSMGAIDSLVFGAETDDLPLLIEIAHILTSEPESYRTILKEKLKEGISYPRARVFSLTEVMKDASIESVLSKPNNILAIEYLKALEKLNSSMKPILLHREGSSYHSENLSGKYDSGTAIRSAIMNGKITEIQSSVPSPVYEVLSEMNGKCMPLSPDDFSGILQEALQNTDDFGSVSGFIHEFSCKIKKELPDIHSYSEWVKLISDKNTPVTTVQRAFLHLMTNSEKELTETFREKNYLTYLRLSGFREDHSDILTEIKKNASVPILSKVADADKILNKTEFELLKEDFRYTSLYRNVVYQKFHMLLPDDYRTPVVRLR